MPIISINHYLVFSLFGYRVTSKQHFVENKYHTNMVKRELGTGDFDLACPQFPRISIREFWSFCVGSLFTVYAMPVKNEEYPPKTAMTIQIISS